MNPSVFSFLGQPSDGVEDVLRAGVFASALVRWELGREGKLEQSFSNLLYTRITVLKSQTYAASCIN